MNDRCPICGVQLSGNIAQCPSCGFNFVGSTAKFDPIDITGPIAGSVQQPTTEHAHLRIVKGPQAEIVFDLPESAVIVGRSPSCDIFLNDMTVSRRHCEIKPEGRTYEITDLNSFNGVWVNNVSIEAAKLSPGDLIQIGAFCLVFEIE